MSRLFPERVSIRLAPREIAVGARAIACDPDFGAEPWQGALAALRSVQFKQPARVTVVLANAFVRYALVPVSEALADEAEEQAYVRHHFAKIHGERVKAWAFRWSGTLASAVDQRLLEALKASFPPKGNARLESVQPEIMSRFNASRSQLPAGGAWLVLAESGRACVALHAGGAWRAVQNGKGDWLALLERERVRLGGEQPDVVLLAGAPSPGAGSRWKFRSLAA